MSNQFYLREAEIPFDQPPTRDRIQPVVHTLPVYQNYQFGYGEFTNSPTSNRRLEFPNP